MNTFSFFFEAIIGAITGFTISDFIDIVLISFIVYKAIKIVRETRAEQLVKGIFLLALSYFISVEFGLKTMGFLLKNLFQIGIIALIILFQPELRRVLEKVGRTHVSVLGVFTPEVNEKQRENWESSIDNISNAADELSKTKTGALIVIERTTRLGEQIDTGVYMDASITVELLLNIFFIKTPLHDGAVIIRDGRILAAACFLPKPQKEEYIATKLGSRHRAAIGISEISDAITVIVSEETGVISISEDGKLTRNFTKESLNRYLKENILPSKDPSEEKSVKNAIKKKTDKLISFSTKNKNKNKEKNKKNK